MFIPDKDAVATDLLDGIYGPAEIHIPQEDGKPPLAQELAAWLPRFDPLYKSVVVEAGIVKGIHWGDAADPIKKDIDIDIDIDALLNAEILEPAKKKPGPKKKA